jgi:hypothetical protein
LDVIVEDGQRLWQAVKKGLKIRALKVGTQSVFIHISPTDF